MGKNTKETFGIVILATVLGLSLSSIYTLNMFHSDEDIKMVEQQSPNTAMISNYNNENVIVKTIDSAGVDKEFKKFDFSSVLIHCENDKKENFLLSLMDFSAELVVPYSKSVNYTCFHIDSNTLGCKQK